MAWGNSIDNLLVHQVHLAEKGEVRVTQIEKFLHDLQTLNGNRPKTAFHLGYAKVLLGVEAEEPAMGSSARRWYLFGMLRAHDRRGERNWAAELIQDPTQLMEILSEPEIAAPCLPVVMRSLLGCGDLKLAISAIEYIATAGELDDAELLVDASLSDLLSRLEAMVRAQESEISGPILRRCISLDAFGQLPGDIRARYLRASGLHFLHCGEFESAMADLQAAFDESEGQLQLRSSIAALAGLAALRVHEFGELRLDPDRSTRDEGVEWFSAAISDEEHAVPEAWFAVGVLSYETGNLDRAVAAFDRATKASRRSDGRDEPLLDYCRFYLGAALIAQNQPEEKTRAVRLLDQALATVHTDLEAFDSVHAELKKLDRGVALKFLDSVEVDRGIAPDQLLLIALEYQGLGEAEPASAAAQRVLEVAVDLDQRVEAMRILLTCSNMRGNRSEARQHYEDIRDLLMQRGALTDLETLLQNEEFVGQALDHLELKCELVSLYEEMEDREVDKATVQTAIARSLRARRDIDSMQEAFGILKEVGTRFPELVQEDVRELEQLLALNDTEPVNLDEGAVLVKELTQSLGRRPKILVVGGNERQRRHHPRFQDLAKGWDFDGEWLMANYSSPQKLVTTIGERLKSDMDLVILLHWNRHETTEPALEIARKNNVPARTVHYAGFTSLQVCLTEMLARLRVSPAESKR